ncbi:hypothetical protein HMPREF1093_03921 [Hungatella hathewayi 12489931]|jgi:AraC-like DNA-binding protein/mannose-6-phosphate isomerase-like protein (cupin superfamily)|uniref:AraC family transcriptional regulator n=1 Tax=Hungatella hathewayi TaxID=154046 RepID=UPI0002D1822D|nr:helix-turn-helix domain-containing protein [Hungatella hathewayi]ENY92199.1 hypothetical protein HMPREF1093_03921 [Hungatella hathewayi 12489931]
MHDNSLNFTFPLEHVSFQVSMVSTGRMVRSIPAHAHGRGCYEIHYIRHGSGTVVIDGVPRRVGQNTLYTTGPSILHEQIPDQSDPMVESCIYLRVFPDFEKMERASFLTPFLEQAFWMGQDTQQVLPLFDTIFQELEQKKPGYRPLLSALFQQLIVCIARNYLEPEAYQPVPENGFEDASGDSSLSLIVEEAFLYEYRTITLERLARRIHLSPRQTERLIRQYYNSTFLKKRTEARIGAASVLLKTTELPVGEIAEMTGYSSSEHFSYAFKTYTGMSAREFRRKSSFEAGPRPLSENVF